MSVRNFKMNTEYYHFYYFHYTGCFYKNTYFISKKIKQRMNPPPFKIPPSFLQDFLDPPPFSKFMKILSLSLQKNGCTLCCVHSLLRKDLQACLLSIYLNPLPVQNVS